MGGWASVLRKCTFLAKAAPDPVQLLDRRRKGARCIELYTDADVLASSWAEIRRRVAEAGLEVRAVHAPPRNPDGSYCGIGSPAADARAEASSRETIHRTMLLADTLTPPGLPRYVVIHFATDLRLPVAPTGGSGPPEPREAHLAAIRERCLDRARETLQALAERFPWERTGEDRFFLCIENKPLVRPGFWEGQGVAAVAGRFPADLLAFIDQANSCFPGRLRAAVALDTAHMLTVCRGARWMAVNGERFALVTGQEIDRNGDLDPARFIGQLDDRIGLVHLANATWIGDTRERHGTPWTADGISHLRAILEALEAASFSGPITIEVVENDPADAQGLASTVSALREVLGWDPFACRTGNGK